VAQSVVIYINIYPMSQTLCIWCHTKDIVAGADGHVLSRGRWSGDGGAIPDSEHSRHSRRGGGPAPHASKHDLRGGRQGPHRRRETVPPRPPHDHQGLQARAGVRV
jgi:hypothetical protein